MKPTELTDSMIDQILEGLDESKLGEWEQGFIKSVRTWWTQNRKLSDKQKKRLDELWRRQHDPKSR
jgi:hypothetical protein